VCKGTGLMCGVVRWAGYCVMAGHSVQGYRVNNVWSFTSLTYVIMMCGRFRRGRRRFSEK
jgi:hypothetical protein